MEVLWAERRDIDRDLDWGSSATKGPTLPISQRELVDVAVVSETFATHDHADDLDCLPSPGHRLSEGHAVPALHDLGSAGAKPKNKTSLADSLQRQRCHGEHRRGAGPELDDPRSQTDAVSYGGGRGDGGQSVVAPELGDPYGIDTQAFRLDYEIQTCLVDGLCPDADGKTHGGKVRHTDDDENPPETLCRALGLHIDQG